MARRAAPCQDRRMNVTDEIWNRAAMHDGGPDARDGDLHLAAVIGTHGLIMSGGLIDAVQRVAPEQVANAEAGYRWLRLHAAADVIVMVRHAVAGGALDDDAIDTLEERVDGEYVGAIPSDQVIVDAFEARFNDDPSTFAPT